MAAAHGTDRAYARFVELHRAFNDDFAVERFASTDTADKLLAVLLARIDCLIHSLHFVAYAFIHSPDLRAARANDYERLMIIAALRRLRRTRCRPTRGARRRRGV
jgi:ribosomal protein S13